MNKEILQKRILLANLPTPVQKTELNGCKFFIKRDDLTGLETSGNKVRKLEYLLYKAKKDKVDYVFTRGGDQSNHCRATVAAATSCGIKSKVFLWGSDSKNADGNLFFNKFYGAETEYFNLKEYKNIQEIMSKQAAEYEKKKKKVLVIPEGGSSEIGILGYVNFIPELYEQVEINKIKGILTAAGSGGTAAGLLAGTELFNIPLKIYAVNVFLTGPEMKERIIMLANKTLQLLDPKLKVNEKRIEVFGDYSTEGYKSISDDKLVLIKQFARQTGIVLDPAYTGKAFKAYADNFLKQGTTSKVLFLHTGGLFGVFPKRKQYLTVK